MVVGAGLERGGHAVDHRPVALAMRRLQRGGRGGEEGAGRSAFCRRSLAAATSALEAELARAERALGRATEPTPVLPCLQIYLQRWLRLGLGYGRVYGEAHPG